MTDAGDEDAVELDFRQRLTRFGEWNDATMDQGYESKLTRNLYCL